MLHRLILPSIHPLFFANVALMLGIYGAFLGYSLTTSFILGSLFCGILLMCNNTKQHAFLLVIPFCFIIGAWRYHHQINDFDYFQQNFTAQICTVTGKIKSIENAENQHFKYKVTVALHHILKKEQKQYVNATIFIYTNKPTDLEVSDIVTVHDIKLNKSNNNSFARYLLKEGASATCFMPQLHCTIEHRPHISFARFIHKLKTQLYKALQNKISHTTFSLFSSLFFGKQTQRATNLSMRDECMEWGISHYLARSGLHLVICIMLWQFFLNMIPLRLFYKNNLLMIVIIIYALLSWNSVSFNRALWLFLVSKWSTLLRLPTQGIHSIICISLCFIAYNPAQLLFIDFQLSFLLTFALMLHNAIQHTMRTLPPVAAHA